MATFELPQLNTLNVSFSLEWHPIWWLWREMMTTHIGICKKATTLMYQSTKHIRIEFLALALGLDFSLYSNLTIQMTISYVVVQFRVSKFCYIFRAKFRRSPNTISGEFLFKNFINGHLCKLFYLLYSLYSIIISVPLLEEVLISVKPNMITTSENLRHYTPWDRQCYFSDERQLRFFKIYTQRNCELECLSNFTLSQCGCVKFSLPSNELIQ